MIGWIEVEQKQLKLEGERRRRRNFPAADDDDFAHQNSTAVEWMIHVH